MEKIQDVMKAYITISQPETEWKGRTAVQKGRMMAPADIPFTFISIVYIQKLHTPVNGLTPNQLFTKRFLQKNPFLKKYT